MEKILVFKQYSRYQPPHKKAIIAIHGWKGNQDSFLPIANSLDIPDACWYLLEGPYTVSRNPAEKSWAIETSPDVWDVETSRKRITDFFIRQIWPVYDPGMVFVIGFSMGALVCYEIILKMDHFFGGVFPVAGFLHNSIKKDYQAHPVQIHTPVLIGHGRDDPVVPAEKSREILTVLNKQGLNVSLELFRGKHKINIAFLNRMRNHIQHKL